jgi:hypothetical protein
MDGDNLVLVVGSYADDGAATDDFNALKAGQDAGNGAHLSRSIRRPQLGEEEAVRAVHSPDPSVPVYELDPSITAAAGEDGVPIKGIDAVCQARLALIHFG